MFLLEIASSHHPASLSGIHSRVLLLLAIILLSPPALRIYLRIIRAALKEGKQRAAPRYALSLSRSLYGRMYIPSVGKLDHVDPSRIVRRNSRYLKQASRRPTNEGSFEFVGETAPALADPEVRRRRVLASCLSPAIPPAATAASHRTFPRGEFTPERS